MEYRWSLYHQDVGKWTTIKDPKGWDGLGRTMKRFGVENKVGQKWHGIFFEYSTKIQFIKDGKAFIQKYYELYGVQQDLLVRIEKRNAGTRKYEVEYIGRVDLTTYNIGTITLGTKIENIGFLQDIKNGLDTKVALTSPFSTTMHCKVLRQYFERKPDLASYVDTPAAPGTYYQLFAIQSPTIDEIGERLDYYDGQISSNTPMFQQYYLFRMKLAGTYRFNFNVKLKRTGIVSNDSTTEIFLTYGRNGSYTTQQVDPSTGTITWFGSPQIMNIQGVISGVALTPGDEVYIYAKHVQTGSDVHTIYEDYDADNTSVIEVYGDTTTDSSTAKVKMIYDAFEQVVQKITGKANSFYSEWLGKTENGFGSDGAGSLRAVTSINQIRGIDKSIYCTLRELIDTVVGIDGVGVGIEKVNGVERVRVEPLTFFYQTKLLMRLNYVKDIEKEFEPDLTFNEIKAGPTKWQNEKVSGLDEFNAGRDWLPPTTRVDNTLDLRIPYTTSGYTIEFARRSSIEPSKDTKYDDDNAIIQMKRFAGSFIPAKNEAFSSVTGIISPETSYNLELSPRRCLERNGRLIRAGLWKHVNDSLTFNFGEANTTMTSTLTGGVLKDEDGDLLVSGLDAPLFVGEVYTARVKMTREQLEALATTDTDADANIYGYIEFSKTNKNHKRGYVIEARPASNSDEVNLRLLRANI